MSTGYGWEGIRQVCATLLGALHVPERLCGGIVYLGRYNKCSTFTFFYLLPFWVGRTGGVRWDEELGCHAYHQTPYTTL